MGNPIGYVTAITEKNVLDIIAKLNEKTNKGFKIVGNEFSAGNPFDSSIQIYISERSEDSFDYEQTLLQISYISELKGYSIRIGYEGYTKWVGGLEFSNCWFGGFTKDLKTESLNECIDKYWGYYGIYKPYGCGNELIKFGTLEDFGRF